MKRKSDKIIKEDRVALNYFTSIYPEGRLMLCRVFKYTNTTAIDRWFERGIPTRLRKEVRSFLTQMSEKHVAQSENTKVIRKRLASVWA